MTALPVTVRSRRVPPRSSDELLPEPPTDVEKFSYFGSRHRWLLLYLFLSFCGVTYGVLEMSLEADATKFLWVFALLLFSYAYLSLRSSIHKRRFEPDGHRERVRTWQPAVMPAVDVFLPTCGEPLEVLRNTYRWVSELQWAGELNVFVLDDGARPELPDIARAFGFHYMSRPDRGRMKKAGNLAHAYARSSGDLILILDADFAPRADMLTELAPYFDDPKIGILQTPQFFDLHDEFNWVQRSSAAVQLLFYRYIQPSRDRVNGAICVGTNAVYSRAALQDSEGFAQINHSEDVHTGMNLIRAGYYVRYLPLVLAKGLCPSSFSGYVNMVYRWCTGSMSLMVDRRFHEAPLEPAQRLCYWTGFFYYLASAAYVVFGSLPGLLMVWLFPGDIHPWNILPLLPSVFGMLIILPGILGTRKIIELVRVNILSGYCFLLAIIDFARRKPAAWVPTGAAKKSPVDLKVRRGLLLWGGTLELLMVTGLVWDCLIYDVRDYWVMIILAAFTLWAYLPLVLPGQGLRAGRATAGPAPRSTPVAVPVAIPVSPPVGFPVVDVDTTTMAAVRFDVQETDVMAAVRRLDPWDVSECDTQPIPVFVHSHAR